MSGHLCLKWNNHSSAFLKSISNIQIKEKYCDATIACQGKYFPVHRIILSTCSDYFDEIFERMQCQHPYIVFKDIEPREMELLLNYMYQGEVNVLQEMLPTLIKAAEALKIKGLAVPDDMPPSKDYTSAKRRSTSTDENPQPKRRLEESRRRRRNSSDLSQQAETSEAGKFLNNDIVSDSSENLKRLDSLDHQVEDNEPKMIKEEPLEPVDYVDGGLQREPVSEDGGIFVDFLRTEDTSSSSTYIKEEKAVSTEPYEDQATAWSDFSGMNVMQNLSSAEVSSQDDMSEISGRSEESGSFTRFRTQLETTTTTTTTTTPRGKENRWTSSQTDSKSQKSSTLSQQCPHCNYRSQRRDHIKLHIKSRHAKHRQFFCTICFKQFKLKHHLKIHMRIHTGEKPYQCPNCFTKFRQKSHLQVHIRTKHDLV